MLSSRARQLPAVPSAPRVPDLVVGALVAPVVPGRPAAWWAVGEAGEQLLVQRVRPAGGTGSGAGGLAGLDEATLRRRLPHPHVVPLLRVERCREGAVQVLGPAAGGCLADVLDERGHLDAGEVAVLVAGLGSALGALHEAGLVHGEVCAAGVLVDHAGLPLLLGWGGARSAVPEGVRRRELRAGGTARRPRVPAPRPADDVRALARLGLQALGPVDDDERRVLAELLRAAAAASAQPGATPSAEGLARACWEAVPPVPLGAGPGALSGGGGAVAQRVRRAAARAAAAAPDQAAGRRRLRARLARHPVRWSAVLLALALLTGGGAAVGAAPAPATDGRLTSDDPATAVRALAELRLRAVSEHDGRLLDRVDVPGTAAALADARLVESLRGSQLEGATARVLSAIVRGRDGDRAWVEVVSVVSAHTRTTGGQRVEVPEGEPVTSRLLLERSGDGTGWRVASAA